MEIRLGVASRWNPILIKLTLCSTSSDVIPNLNTPLGIFRAIPLLLRINLSLLIMLITLLLVFQNHWFLVIHKIFNILDPSNWYVTTVLGMTRALTKILGITVQVVSSIFILNITSSERLFIIESLSICITSTKTSIAIVVSIKVLNSWVRASLSHLILSDTDINGVAYLLLIFLSLRVNLKRVYESTFGTYVRIKASINIKDTITWYSVEQLSQNMVSRNNMYQIGRK